MRHIIPIGGEEPLHVAADVCWCFPLYHPSHGVWEHNAKDCREAKERHGLEQPGLGWVVIVAPPFHPHDFADERAPRPLIQDG